MGGNRTKIYNHQKKEEKMKRTKTNPPLILVNDPSMTAWGWAIVDAEGCVKERGCIKTQPQARVKRIRKSDDRVQRAHEISSALLELIRSNNIRLILAELPHGSQNAQAAIMLGIVAGILQAMADATGVPIEWYSEGDAKKALLNKRSATKEETIDKIAELYDVELFGVKYKDEAVADAMAVFHVAKRDSQLLKMLGNG